MEICVHNLKAVEHTSMLKNVEHKSIVIRFVINICCRKFVGTLNNFISFYYSKRKNHAKNMNIIIIRFFIE